MASMLAGMGGMAGLQQMMGGMGGGMPAFNPEGAADEPEDDDDVPELVENFEAAAAK
jgi:nascent polypeptide-associated complex subunit beta